MQVAGVEVESPLDQLLHCIDTGAEPESSVAIGADVMGVLAVGEESHRDFLYGVNAFLPSAGT